MQSCSRPCACTQTCDKLKGKSRSSVVLWGAFVYFAVMVWVHFVMVSVTANQKKVLLNVHCYPVSAWECLFQIDCSIEILE